MSEDTEEHRAIEARKAELDAEEAALAGEVKRHEQALIEVRKRAQARRDEILGEREKLARQLGELRRAARLKAKTKTKKHPKKEG